jgi:hypothetical protein
VELDGLLAILCEQIREIEMRAVMPQMMSVVKRIKRMKKK